MSADKGPAESLPPDLAAEAAAMLAESDADQDQPGPTQATTDQADQANTPNPETVAMIVPVVGALFNTILAPSRGEHWVLADAEIAGLSMACAPVLDKYLPGMKLGVEAAAIMALTGILWPRLAADIAAAKTADQDAAPTIDQDAAGEPADELPDELADADQVRDL